MMAHPTVCWHKTINLLVGTVMPVATNGVRHLIGGLASKNWLPHVR